ncbi:MAG TPA: M15 family metallopeptidase [Gemmatimonadales bacterium]|nr:M15 family metallopeptidase [Gemmatimonadales bacterium]
MEQFRNPQFVNQMQYLGISSPFRGGQMQLFNNKQGQSGLLEQLYQRMGGQGADWNKVLMPGSQQRQMLESMGMAPEQMRLLQQYGAARQEGVSPNDEKEWNRRFKDTGESLKELQKAFSELMDTLATGLVPLIKGLNTVLSPAVDFFEKLNDQVPALGQAVGVATTALLIWAAAAKAQSKIGAISAAVAERQAAGQAGGIGLAGLGAKLGSGGVALSAGGTLLATGGMLLGGIGGSMLGRKVGGKGTKGKIGSVLGGAGGGALTGAALGAAATAWGGPLAGLGAGTGAVAGGIIGGVAGLFGDAWPEWMREDVGDSDATPKDPAGGPASGKDLRGAKASDSNMNPEFARRLKQMFADNPALSLTSGWRDSATQARLFKEKPGLAAPPGKSNHEKGTAADIGPSSEYGWIAANASKYGLFLPMPSSADRKASGKKIEPWHVEPVGLTGSVPVQAVSADAVTPAGQKAPAKGKPKMTASPEVAPGGGMNVAGGSPAYQSATAVLGKTGGTQIGDAWGDNEVDYYGTSGRSGGRGKASITIGRIEINVSIARATPEEADRFARSVGSMLGDRDRLLALARTGGRDN